MLDAEILLAHVLQQSRSFLYAHANDELSAEQVAAFDALLTRRAAGEPLAYITGSKEFWSLNLKVTPDTLIPRPDTELLVEEVLKLFPHQQKLRVADLGAGSGAIALALASEHPEWDVFAVDISEAALAVVRNNAQRLGIDNVSICHGNWFTALPAVKLDVIVSNPPYVALQEWQDYADGLQFEPRSALLSGVDGLDDIRKICSAAREHLSENGYIFLEHGFQQGQAVREILAAAGFVKIRTIQDYAGKDRVTLGCLLVQAD